MLRWALNTFAKGMKIRLGKNWLSILAERIVPSIEITDGVMNLRLIMMDMGCAVYDLVYVIKSLWMSEHALHFSFYHSWIVEVLLALLPGVKIIFLFSGTTFHIPLTKSATLNRLLHCSLWQFSGALFLFSRALFCISGTKSPGAPV